MRGSDLHAFASGLYPICRSITGDGVRQTLQLVGQHISLEVHEVPSGSAVYDWEVPLEWNVDDAYVLAPDGRKVIDFREHNLHLVSYSEPHSGSQSLADLDARLHSLPEHPSWIPYRTSYYNRNWGFCLRHETRVGLVPGSYHIDIRSSLAPGSLTYGEFFVPGRSRSEVLFFTHVCHPSLANDNTSGIAVATALATWIAGESRKLSYRFVFAPGTIGSLCWLRRNESRLSRIRGGLVLGLLGDSAPFTYKMSRTGGAWTDKIAGYIVSQLANDSRVIPFEPYGYDERQLCSPGFNLPVGRLTRSVNGGYPEYHSSADNLDLIRSERLAESLDLCKTFVTLVEEDSHYVNLSPKGEPRLGKRGLYGSLGGRSPAEREEAMLWVLNQSDGSNSLLEIAQKSGVRFGAIREAALDLEKAGLLARRRSPSLHSRAGGRR